jgi:hypothetical protein
MTLILLIIILIFIVSLILGPAKSNTSQHGGSDFRTREDERAYWFTKRMIPFENPFRREFFYDKKNQYKVLCKSYHIPLLKQIIGPEHQYVEGHSDEPLPELDREEYDFVVMPEYRVALRYRPDLYRNIRFMTAIHPSVIYLLAPDISGLNDVADFDKVRGPVRIGLEGHPGGREHTAYMNLANYYPGFERNCKAVFLEPHQVASEYGRSYDVFLAVTIRPLEYLKAMTEKIPSHFLYMREINAGSYFISEREKPFYRKFPYYRKYMLDLLKMRKLYPALSAKHDEIYIPVIQSKNVILTNTRVPPLFVAESILRLLKVMNSTEFKSLFENIVPLDLSTISLNMPHHRGAIKIYNDLQLFSNVGQSSFYEPGGVLAGSE